MTNSFPDRFWLRLDNAAKLFPAIQNKELTAVFRIKAVLKRRVKIAPLIEAVRTIENRFPYFKMKLKTGFFWYYLEYDEQPVSVKPDFDIPCRAFEKDEILYRILAKENEIIVEFSHILTDGSGAFDFLKTLLSTYFSKCHIEGVQDSGFNSPIQDEEFEDAYNRYFQKVNAPQVRLPKAFHIPYTRNNKPKRDLLTALISFDKIYEKAKEQNVSVTNYLIAVYLYALQEVHDRLPEYQKRKSRKLLRVQVPINLRKIFPSITMRNFTLFMLPGIDLRLGHYAFDEIVKLVYHQIQLESDKKLIHKTMSRNVGGEKNAFVRCMPLFLKSLMLSRIYAAGANQFSGVLTNYGKVELPLAMEEQIERFVFIPPPPNKRVKINCGALGFKDKISLSFGNITVSKELERYFLTFLTRQGIPVKLIKS